MYYRTAVSCTVMAECPALNYTSNRVPRYDAVIEGFFTAYLFFGFASMRCHTRAENDPACTELVQRIYETIMVPLQI